MLRMLHYRCSRKNAVNRDSFRHFLALSRALHFGHASRECHLSPSALSRSIQRLEDEVGQRLFERDNRSVSLTPAGVEFQSYAADALARWDRLRDRLGGQGQRLEGTLSVFATVTACHSFLPRVLGRFREAHPGIHLRIETGNAASALGRLEDDAVEVSVAPLPERTPRHLRTRPIAETPVIFVAPRAEGEVSRLVDRRPIPWAEIPLVLPESGPAREDVNRWLRRRRLTPPIYSEVPGNEAILSLVSLGCGVGIVPRLVLEKSPLRGELRSLDVRPQLERFRIGLCVKARKLRSPLVRALWEAVGDPEPDAAG
jgi:LysR family positive regulator for ilvC